MLTLNRKACWLLGLLPGLLVGYVIGHREELANSSIVDVQERTLRLQSEGLTKLKQELEVKNTQLTTQKIAFEQLQQMLKTQESQLQEQKRQLAFFERIMRPDGEQSGVVVDNLVLETTSIPERIHYRIALTQPSRQRELLRGQVDIRVEGSKEGKPLTLSPRSLGMKEGEVRYALRYFQMLEGVWTLPAGFTPDKVMVRIAKGATQPEQELSVNWSEALRPLPVVASSADSHGANR